MIKKIIKQLLKASHYSYDGIKATYQHEFAFRIEVALLIILSPLALYIGENWIEKSLLIASLLGVLLVEIINSAIEATVDLISPEKHSLAKRAKDQGSASVFIAVILAAIIWSGLILT